MSSKKIVRCGVIGYGGAFNMGKHHATAMSTTPGFELTTVCDLDPSRTEAAREDFPGIQTYTEVRKMLAKAPVDLVAVVTPHNTHAKLAIQCSKAGKHVIVEKPMCLTIKEATAMIEAAKAAGTMTTVFHNRRHDGDFKAVMQVIREGLLGEVFHLESFMGGYHKPRTDWWRADKRISGGAFYDWGAHVVDWTLNIMGRKMESVTGFFHKRVWHQMTNEDQVQALIRFEGGACADVQQSSIALAGKPKWRILGTKGALVQQSDHLDVYTQVKGHRAHLEVPFQESGWQGYYTNIADHLLRGKELDVKPEEGRRVIAVLELAEKSSAAGKAMPVPYEG